jgi:hypothetical protein
MDLIKLYVCIADFNSAIIEEFLSEFLRTKEGFLFYRVKVL